MSNILNYTDEVMQGVRSLLYDIDHNNGKLNTAMVNKHLEDFKGHYAADSANGEQAEENGHKNLLHV